MRRIRLITTPRAQRDIDEHALFIAGENLDAGLRFWARSTTLVPSLFVIRKSGQRGDSTPLPFPNCASGPFLGSSIG